MDSAEFGRAHGTELAAGGDGAALRVDATDRSVGPGGSLRDGLALAKIILADSCLIAGLSLLALAKRLGVSPTLVRHWVDPERPERAPLGLLYALPASARDAVLSMSASREVAAGPTRTVDGLLLHAHERLASIGAAFRDGHVREARRLWHLGREDHRLLGAALAALGGGR